LRQTAPAPLALFKWLPLNMNRVARKLHTWHTSGKTM